MFELDGGLKSQSLRKVGFICFLGSDISRQLIFPTRIQYLQMDTSTYKILKLHKTLFPAKRDSQHTFGLECGLDSPSLWKLASFIFVGVRALQKRIFC